MHCSSSTQNIYVLVVDPSQRLGHLWILLILTLPHSWKNSPKAADKQTNKQTKRKIQLWNPIGWDSGTMEGYLIVWVNISFFCWGRRMEKRQSRGRTKVRLFRRRTEYVENKIVPAEVSDRGGRKSNSDHQCSQLSLVFTRKILQGKVFGINAFQSQRKSEHDANQKKQGTQGIHLHP